MRIVRLVFLVVFVGLMLGGFQWYRYITNTESPYQEVGIELNSRMPEPIRKWGCDRLHETFANTLPPYGCQAGDGTSWM
ncbi:hypothetical protein [Rhizobium sp. 18065]|uniref:hypothetical protein n=1 Tax=Rhizobium sp. 18065 TaxID=2681411 RepID=UPI001FCE9FA2|nr:hypothetical protein [Rhizobium sp. 18065]